MKVNEMHYFSYLFDKVLYMFRTCPLSIIRNISTLYASNRYLSCYFCWRLLAWSPVWARCLESRSGGKWGYVWDGYQ